MTHTGARKSAAACMLEEQVVLMLANSITAEGLKMLEAGMEDAGFVTFEEFLSGDTLKDFEDALHERIVKKARMLFQNVRDRSPKQGWFAQFNALIRAYPSITWHEMEVHVTEYYHYKTIVIPDEIVRSILSEVYHGRNSLYLCNFSGNPFATSAYW